MAYELFRWIYIHQGFLLSVGIGSVCDSNTPNVTTNIMVSLSTNLNSPCDKGGGAREDNCKNVKITKNKTWWKKMWTFKLWSHMLSCTDVCEPLGLTISTFCSAKITRCLLVFLHPLSPLSASLSFTHWPSKRHRNSLLLYSWLTYNLYLSFQFYYCPLIVFTFACFTSGRRTPMRRKRKNPHLPPLFFNVSSCYEKNGSNIHFSLYWLHPKTALLLFSKVFCWIFSLKEFKRQSFQGDFSFLFFRKWKNLLFFNPHHK